MVYYPCTGDGVKSREGTAVPVVAGAAMRQGAVRTGIRAGPGHRRLPVSAKRSYDLHGGLGPKRALGAEPGSTGDGQGGLQPSVAGGGQVSALKLSQKCQHFGPEGFPGAGRWRDNEGIVRLSKRSRRRTLGGGPCLWRQPMGRATAPLKAAPVGRAQSPLRETDGRVEPLLPQGRLGEREATGRPRGGRTARRTHGAADARRGGCASWDAPTHPRRRASLLRRRPPHSYT